MNTHSLDELRRTLDAHAGDVHDDAGHARTAAVHGRAAVVRRRRAAAVTVAAALAVVGAIGIPRWLADPGPDPAAAPATRTALGWSYELADTVHEDGDALTLRLGEARYPRLLSWATDGVDQEVELRAGWAGRFHSDRGDFDDHVLLPAGYSGKVRLSGPDGLSLATYTLDTGRWPAGVGTGPRTFREEVAGYDLLGADVGEPGQATVEFDLVPRGTTTWVGYYCEQLPKGYRMHINWVGAEGSLVFGGCDGSATFDPGGSAGAGLTTGRRAGTPQALRMWVTRRGDRVPDGELPDLRLGLGAYTPSAPPTDLVGLEKPQRLEHVGHVYELVEVRRAGPAASPRLDVPEEGEFVVSNAFRGRGPVRLALTVDGTRVEGSSIFNTGGAGGTGEEVVPAGSVVRLEFGRTVDNVRASGLALYRRVD